MTGAQFELHDLVLIPLTPIHVGGGEEARLLPEDYRLNDGFVERIAVRAVLDRLPAAERLRWLADMSGARGDASVSVIRDALMRLQQKATKADILERIAISADSARNVDLSGEGRHRKNQIDAFFRTGGRATLPGSSLKGMLRTAWTAACARISEPALPPMQEWRALRPREKARHASQAVERILGMSEGKRAQDSDPFRDVTVSDAALPDGATRIDPIHTWKLPRIEDAPARGVARTYGFESRGEMHRERLRGVADGGAPPEIALTIGLRTATVRKLGGERDPAKRPLSDRTPASLGDLLSALEAHHAPLWTREVEEKFFKDRAGARLREALALFTHLRRGGERPEAALVRLGWAAHAEAKSLAGHRRIERRQARGDGQIASEGSARHVVNLGGYPLPFGWALLIRAEVWANRRPRAWLNPPASGTGPARGAGGATASTDRRADSALGQQVRYRKGQKVIVSGDVARLLEDVTDAMRDNDDVNVDFGGGSEPVRIRDIEGPA